MGREVGKCLVLRVLADEQSFMSPKTNSASLTLALLSLSRIVYHDLEKDELVIKQKICWMVK